MKTLAPLAALWTWPAGLRLMERLERLWRRRRVRHCVACGAVLAIQSGYALCPKCFQPSGLP